MDEYSLKKQCADALKPYMHIGMSKQQQKESGIVHAIRSLGASDMYHTCGKKYFSWRQQVHIDPEDGYTIQDVNEFLEEIRNDYSQSYLNNIVYSINLITKLDVARVKSGVVPNFSTRAYSDFEIAGIRDYLKDDFKFAIDLLLATGMRVGDLYQMMPLEMRGPSPGRDWRPDLFTGLEDYVIFTVWSKGRLIRMIAIPASLKVILDQLYMPKGKWIRHRGRDIKTFYDVPGGNRVTNAVTQAARASIGESRGAHAFRHTYARNRLLQLWACGISKRDSIYIVSQELGHFRPIITFVYTR